MGFCYYFISYIINIIYKDSSSNAICNSKVETAWLLLEIYHIFNLPFLRQKVTYAQ